MLLNDLLGAAYHHDQIKVDRLGAVAMIRAVLDNDEEVAAQASERLRQLRAIVASRSLAGMCGCHVSKITCDLLGAALTPE